MKRFLLFLLLLVSAGGILDSADRSERWPTVRAEHLRSHPVCEACGRNLDLEVHHVTPFSNDPTKELDRTNLITLCHRDHLVFGHFGSYQKYNPQVQAHARQYRAWKLRWEMD